MPCCRILAVSFVLGCLGAVPALSQCGPNLDSQLTAVRDSWVKNWNERQLDSVVRLYKTQADLLLADGSRASGWEQIRAALEKQTGSKVEVHSAGIACSDGLAFDTGFYTQTSSDKRIQGNYLLVLAYLPSSAGKKWLIVQHALTAKP